MRPAHSDIVTQIHRYLAIVDHVASAETVEVGDLALIAGVSKASIYRILREMQEALGVVIELDGRGRCRLESAGVVLLPILTIPLRS